MSRHDTIPRMKKWQFWVGVLISILFVWLSLRGLRLEQFWGAVKKANYIWLVPGVAVYFVGVWVRAWRWHYLLGPIKKIPTETMFPITTIGYMGNNVYPARAGEGRDAAHRDGVPGRAEPSAVRRTGEGIFRQARTRGGSEDRADLGLNRRVRRGHPRRPY